MKNKHNLIKKILSEIIKSESKTTVYLPYPHLVKKIRTYMLIDSILNSVIEANNELIKLNSDGKNIETIQKRALWNFMIVSYAKCFTDSSKSKLSKLEASDCFKQSPNFLPLHEEIMRIRHDFVAHRNDDEFEQAVVYLVPDKKNNKTQYKIKSLTLSSGKIEILKRLSELFSYVQNIAYQKMEKQIDKFDNKINSITKSEFDKLFIYPK